jgi:hypothetical protein
LTPVTVILDHCEAVVALDDLLDARALMSESDEEADLSGPHRIELGHRDLDSLCTALVTAFANQNLRILADPGRGQLDDPLVHFAE